MSYKIAFVCQRYGLEVNGGAELYCRQMAEKMTERYDVEVFTTCAVDYVTWADYYQSGTEQIHGVTVHRFPVDRERDQDAFAHISQRVMGNPRHSDADEAEWIEQQGPVCTELLGELERVQKDYLAVIFMTYLYYLTAKGTQMRFDNAFLIPTVHDEPPVYLRWYDNVFGAVKGIIWNTPEERAFAERRFPQVRQTPSVIAGVGVDLPEGELPELPEMLRGIHYVTYAGRIDESKGCGEMFEYFQRYKREYGDALKLVLMGKPVMPVPNDPDIISLGFVSDEIKFSVIRSAKALVLFSRFESLSMVVLESMTVGRPVLVTGRCEVLKGHCVRSNAGLYFDNYPEFVGCMQYLMSHESEYAQMCKNGKAYVTENYQWDVIIGKIQRLIDHG